MKHIYLPYTKLWHLAEKAEFIQRKLSPWNIHSLYTKVRKPAKDGLHTGN